MVARRNTTSTGTAKPTRRLNRTQLNKSVEDSQRLLLGGAISEMIDDATASANGRTPVRAFLWCWYYSWYRLTPFLVFLLTISRLCFSLMIEWE
jgi:hypothetical protein